MFLGQRNVFSFGIAVVLAASMLYTAASAEKIRVHYDKSIDFAKYKTYGWAPVGAVSHPMLALDIVGAVDQEMAARVRYRSRQRCP